MYKGRTRLIFTFLLPAALLYAVFFLWPALQSLYLSLFEWSGVGEKTFIGLRNFRELVTILEVNTDGKFPFVHPTYGDIFFWPSVGHTLTNVFLGGVVTFGLAFADRTFEFWHPRQKVLPYGHLCPQCDRRHCFVPVVGSDLQPSPWSAQELVNAVGTGGASQDTLVGAR